MHNWKSLVGEDDQAIGSRMERKEKEINKIKTDGLF